MPCKANQSELSKSKYYNVLIKGNKFLVSLLKVDHGYVWEENMLYVDCIHAKCANR